MTEHPRDERRTEDRTIEAPVPVRSAPPALQALDLGLVATGMVCDIDDLDCSPMTFVGTSGAPAMTGEGDEV